MSEYREQDELVKQALSIGERLDDLGQDLMAEGFFIVSQIRSGAKPTSDQMERQTLLQAEFKKLQSIYTTLVRLGRIEKKPASAGEFDRKFLDKIKDKQSTLGNIVQDRGGK